MRLGTKVKGKGSPLEVARGLAMTTVVAAALGLRSIAVAAMF